MKELLVTTQEILEKSGIKVGKTLTRWHQAGLIPPPTIGTHPSGRGKVAYWPAWVMQRCIRIRQLVDHGMSLAEIGATLGKNWEQEERRYRRRYDFRTASERLDIEKCLANLDELVSHKLAPFWSRMKNGRDLNEKWTNLAWQEGAKGILQLAQAGFNVVLVIDGESLWVVPDFIISHTLAMAPKGPPLIVVAITEEVRAAFSGTKYSVPDKIKVVPSQKIRVLKGRASEEREVRLVGPTDFEIAE
jgi:DNA-binding transcriptional MerR regulator